MFARIKPRAVVWIRSNPGVWGGGDFVKGWKYFTTGDRQEYCKEISAKIFEVDKYYKNRLCVLLAPGYGAKERFGQGPIRVRSENLVILREEYAESVHRI